jgi:rhomboid family GlyGly-CTERM serine protease
MLPKCKFRAAARRIPCVSLLLGGVAVVVHFVPNVAALMQYDTTAIAAGQVWRVVTCHATHWSLDHLVWDVGALVVLGALCEVPYRRAFACCVAASALLIPLAVWTLLPEVGTYRGLSGIDSAVFVLLAVMILGESLAARQIAWAVTCAAVLLAFASKVGYECVTDATLFVDSAAASMVPIPLAHVIGGLVGAVCGMYTTLVSHQTTGVTSAATAHATQPPIANRLGLVQRTRASNVSPAQPS